MKETQERRPKAAATAPDWLPHDARIVWDKLAPDLEALGLLSTTDQTAFATLCVLLSELRWTVRQRRRFIKDSSGQQRLHPIMKHRVVLIEKIERLCGEFGMTPASWPRVAEVALGGLREPPAASGGATDADGTEKVEVLDRLGNPV